MHELAIAQNILEAVQGLRDARGNRPAAVVVRAGPFAQVSRDALAFGFDASKKSFDLEECRLVFEESPGRLRCVPCDLPFDFAGAFDCPRCGSPAAEILAGRELIVDAVDFPD